MTPALRLALPELLGGLLLAGCSVPPARPPAPLAPVATAQAPAARWVRANRGAQIGPAVPGGTLVLLGGRRAVVAADGRLEAEKVAAPEALRAIAAAPTARGPVIIGLAATHLYRFDDPLGAAVPLVEWHTEYAWLSRVRAGAVDVTNNHGDVMTFDPLTGARLGGCWSDAQTNCPRPPRPAEESPPEPRAPAPRSPALLRWIAATGADPLALAVTDGAKLDDRTAVVASNGLVARVDLERGTIVELVAYEEKMPAPTSETCGSCGYRAPRDHYRHCEAAHAGREIWFFCPWTGDLAAGTDPRRMPLGVLAVHGGAGGLTVKPVRAFATFGRDDKPLVSSSSTGGLLLWNPCDLAQLEAIITKLCVRQPDGSFSTFAGAASVWPKQDLPGSSFVPLSSGRLAGVHGAYVQGAPDAAPIHVKTFGPTGELTSLPALPITFPPDTQVTVTGAAEVDGALDVALLGLQWPAGTRATSFDNAPIRTGWLARQPLTDGPAAVRRIPGASAIAVGHGHAIAVISERVLSSSDGGATLLDEAAPGPVRTRHTLFVNEVGALIDDHDGDGWLRVGWGPVAPP